MGPSYWSGAAVSALLVFASGAASAQVAGEAVPGESTALFNADSLARDGLFARTADVSVTQRPHPEYEALGAPLGSFTLDAAVRAGVNYDDDVLAQPGSASDEILLIQPSVQLQSNWSRHYVSVFARAADNVFTTLPDQTTLNYAVGSNDRVDLGRDLVVALGGSYERATEPRTDLGSPIGAAKPVRFNRARAYLGGVKQFDRLRLVLDADLQDDTFDNAQTSTGAQIYQLDRDTTTATISARAEYAVNAGASIYVSAAGNARSFRNTLAGDPSRNSNGYDVAVGSNFDLTHLIRGEVEVGYLDQFYKSSAFPTVSGVSLRGSLQYFFSPATTFTLSSTQTVGNSDIVNSAGYLQTVEQLTADHELRRNLILSVKAGNENDSIRGVDRHDDRPFAGFSLKYHVNRSLGVVGGYDFYRDSSTGTLRGQSYDINRVFVSFIYQTLKAPLKGTLFMESRASNIGRPEALVEPETPSLDIGRYIGVFRRHLRLFVGVVLGVLLLAILITFLTKPRYTATAEVMIDTRKHTVVNVEAVTSDLPTDDTSVVDTEVEVLRSRALAERVVAAEKLESDTEFYKPGSGTAVTPQRVHELVVDAVMKNLKVARTGLTYVIGVSFKSKDPVKATRLANAFAAQYLAQQLADKADANARASVWLGSQLDAMRAQVESAEAAVAAYKKANGLMSAEGNTLTEQDISNLTEQAATAKAAQAVQDAKLATARAQLAHGSNGEDVGEALASPVIQQLRAQRAEVSRNVADLSSRYGPRYPDLTKAQQQLNDIDAQIHAETVRIISGLVAEDEAARSRTASTEASLAGIRGNLAQNDAASVHLNELQRNADSARTLYESFLDRYKQTTAQQGLQESDAKILSLAKTPTRPSSPIVLLNLAIGLVVGLGAATVTVILVELLAPGISTSSEVEQRLGVSSMGTLPLLSSTVKVSSTTHPETYLIQKPFSAFTEAFRNLNTAIHHGLGNEGGKVVAITSALPDEGKTTTTICLARALALSGASVVVVDCDLRRRALHRVLHRSKVGRIEELSDNKIGLIEVLSGKASLEAALKRDEASGAYFLPLAQGDLTTEDVFGSPAMSRLLETLRTKFSHVLLDTAPILPVADTRKLAPKADGVVLLARWRKTNRNAIAAAIKQLDMSGARLLGVALTQVDVRQQARSGAGHADYALNTYRNYYIQ